MNWIVLCIALNWGVPAHTLRGCKGQMRRAGIRLKIDSTCSEATTSEVEFFKWISGNGAGVGKLDTYGRERGWVKVWVPLHYERKMQRRFINRVLCHELGHNLGMRHNDNERSIMYWTTKNIMKRQRFTRKDLKALERYK